MRGSKPGQTSAAIKDAQSMPKGNVKLMTAEPSLFPEAIPVSTARSAHTLTMAAFRSIAGQAHEDPGEKADRQHGQDEQKPAQVKIMGHNDS
jgi:hypothetical protein